MKKITLLFCIILYSFFLFSQNGITQGGSIGFYQFLPACSVIDSCLGINGLTGDSTRFLGSDGLFHSINGSVITDSIWADDGARVYLVNPNRLLDINTFNSASRFGVITNKDSALGGQLGFCGIYKFQFDLLIGNLDGIFNPYAAGASPDPQDTVEVRAGFISLGTGEMFGLMVNPYNNTVDLKSGGEMRLYAKGNLNLQSEQSSYFGTNNGHGITTNLLDSTIQINSLNSSIISTNTCAINAPVYIASNTKYWLNNNTGDSLETNTALIRDVYITQPATKFTRNTGAGNFSNIHAQGIVSGNYAAAGASFENTYQYATNNKFENNTINTTYNTGVPQYAWVFQNDNCVFSGNYIQGSAFAFWDNHQGENDSIFDNIVTGYGGIIDNVIQVVNDKFNHNRFTADSFSLANVQQDGEANFEHDTVSGTGFTVRSVKMINGSSIYDSHWNKYHGFMEGVTLNSSILNRCSGNLRNMYLFNYQMYGDTADHQNEVWFGSPIKIKDGTQGTGKVLTSDSVGNASWQIPQHVYTLYTQTDTTRTQNDTFPHSLIKTGIGSMTIGANTATVGSTYNLSLRGFHSNNSFDNLVVRILMDGVVIDSNIVTSGAGAVNTAASINAIITLYTAGSSGTYWIQGAYNEEGVTSGSLATHAAQTIDTTVPHTFDVSIQWRTKTPSDAWTVSNLVFEKLN